MTKHKFEADAFICININGRPSVQEIRAGDHLATTHFWTQHDTIEAAIAAAQAIDPAYTHEEIRGGI